MSKTILMDIEEIQNKDPEELTKEYKKRDPEKVEKELKKITQGTPSGKKTSKTPSNIPEGGYTRIPNKFIIDPRLKKQDKIVIQCLYYHSFGKTSCYPSQKLLAKESGMNVREVQRALYRLEDNGYIRIEKDGRRNVYHLNPKSED